MANDDPEHRLSHYVDEMLQRIMVEPCWYTAQDHSGRAIHGSAQAQMNWRAKQKWYGVKPAQLDWRMYQYPLYTEFELKDGKKPPSDGQAVTMRKLKERKIPTACLGDIRSVFEFIRDSGFILHGNAENLCTETVERWAAANEKARGRNSPRKIGKMRAFKPSAARIRKSEAMRGRVPH